MDILTHVPVEVAAHILSCGVLSISEVCCLARVSHGWSALVHSDIIWLPLAHVCGLHMTSTPSAAQLHQPLSWRTRALKHELRARQLGRTASGRLVPPLLPPCREVQRLSSALRPARLTTAADGRDDGAEIPPAVHVAGSPRHDVLALWAPDGPNHTVVWTIDLVTHKRLWEDRRPYQHMSTACIAGEGYILMLHHCVSHRNHCVQLSIWKWRDGHNKGLRRFQPERPPKGTNPAQDEGQSRFAFQGEMNLSGSNLFSGNFGPTYFAAPLLAVGPSWALMNAQLEWPAKVKIYNVETMAYVQAVNVAPAIDLTGPFIGLQPMEMCFPQALAFDLKAQILFFSYKHWGANKGQDGWLGNTVAVSMETDEPLWSTRSGRLGQQWPDGGHARTLPREALPTVLVPVDASSEDPVTQEQRRRRRLRPLGCFALEDAEDDALVDMTGRLALSPAEGTLLAAGPRGCLILRDYRTYLTGTAAKDVAADASKPATFCVILSPMTDGQSRRSSDATLNVPDMLSDHSKAVSGSSGTSRSPSTSTVAEYQRSGVPLERPSLSSSINGAPCAVALMQDKVLWVTPYFPPILCLIPEQQPELEPGPERLEAEPRPHLFALAHLPPHVRSHLPFTIDSDVNAHNNHGTQNAKHSASVDEVWSRTLGGDGNCNGNGDGNGNGNGDNDADGNTNGGGGSGGGGVGGRRPRPMAAYLSEDVLALVLNPPHWGEAPLPALEVQKAGAALLTVNLAAAAGTFLEPPTGEGVSA